VYYARHTRIIHSRQCCNLYVFNRFQSFSLFCHCSVSSSNLDIQRPVDNEQCKAETPLSVAQLLWVTMEIPRPVQRDLAKIFHILSPPATGFVWQYVLLVITNTKCSRGNVTLGILTAVTVSCFLQINIPVTGNYGMARTNAYDFDSQNSGHVPTSPFHSRPSHLSCQVCCDE